MTATARGPLRHVLVHLVTPLLMCLGMGLAYMSAFVTPEPHHLPVAVVGSDARAHDVTRSLGARAGDALDVRPLASRAEAVDELKSLDISGAYVPDAKTPELLIASAGSDMSALATEKAFTPLAAAQGAPLKVTDVAAPVDDDPTGQGLFFLLVAVSIGSYASVAALGAAGAGLRMRTRAALAAGVSLAVSVIGAALAGPVFHLAHHGLAGVWAMAWLYSAGILFIGLGLHTFLKRWTTLVMMILFVMLNFTSSGGLFRPELQNGFYGSLHSFWNGAGFVEGVRGQLYFDGHDLGRSVLTLVVWLAAGLTLTAVAALRERGQRAAALAASRPAAAPAGEAAEEEMEESVGV
ncbi:hypothetical protein [Streptomyces flavofungini]|uniref:ABC transporter permease n=1 Tax=Streptomyces flavofungini TaxID=68200 RepID=A0ABS0X8Q6_9ACTN|nr:hypothetical protein [Streptomyces flavofungini]MBJ3809591.1 hypothetical protein [Streptomyces flavofungini]GHC55678.1 membrane protein [Streptomyces flavofungini]